MLLTYISEMWDKVISGMNIVDVCVSGGYQDSHSTCGASALMLPSFFRIYPPAYCALRCVQDVGLHYANVKTAVACMMAVNIDKLLMISLLFHLLTQNVVIGTSDPTHLKTDCRCSSVCCQLPKNESTKVIAHTIQSNY